MSRERGQAPPIIHTHAYTDGGKQTFDWQVYAHIIEGIRAEVDVPAYPSYPPHADAAMRFAHIEALAARGLLDFAVIDALDFAARHDLHPAFAIYEPGFTPRPWCGAGLGCRDAAGARRAVIRGCSLSASHAAPIHTWSRA